MYVAVKGGEQAIANAHQWLAAERRGDPAVPELDVRQIEEQLGLGVARVMNEGSLCDPELAALALKQARADLVEAAFLLRAYRTTLPRFGYAQPIDTGQMRAVRRISATYKDLPGGQILGPTFDYTHRLLDFLMLVQEGRAVEAPPELPATPDPLGKVLDILDIESLIEREPMQTADAPIADLTREPLLFPVGRDLWLQNLARADEGFLLALGYSTQRGFGGTHPFVGELRIGEVELEFEAEEVGFAVPLGAITVSECEMVNQFTGGDGEAPRFSRGYGLAFGHAERRTISMALVDRALRNAAHAGESTAPAEDQEFVLYHSDNVQATGFVEHLKLPHYVDFQGELEAIRRLRRAAEPMRRDPAGPLEPRRQAASTPDFAV